MNEIDVGARDRMMEEERKQKIGNLLNDEQEKQIFIADQFCQKKVNKHILLQKEIFQIYLLFKFTIFIKPSHAQTKVYSHVLIYYFYTNLYKCYD